MSGPFFSVPKDDESYVPEPPKFPGTRVPRAPDVTDTGMRPAPAGTLEVTPPDVSVPALGEIPGDTAAGGQDTEGTVLGLTGENIATPLVDVAPRAMGVMSPEGQNYLPGGGPQAQTKWQEIQGAAGQIGRDINAGAQAEEDAGTQRAKFYQSEQERQSHANAVLQERRQAQLDQIEAQHAQIKQASEKYTNDLADRGQWWRNGGNVVSAFAAALMTLGSDDHAIGFKLINNAIQHDFNQRKTLADMHLGELRSNLANYRQLAGDKNTGDLLAENENRRVAAMELERIAAQSFGPIQKAKAAAISKELMRQYGIQEMQIYNRMFYNAPHLTTPALLNAYKAGGKAFPGVGFTTFSSMAPGADQPAQTGKAGLKLGPMQGPGGSSGGGASFQTTVGPHTQSGQAEFMTDTQRHAFNQQYPGAGDQIGAERASIVREIMADIGLSPNAVHPNMTDAQISAVVQREAARNGNTTAQAKFNSAMVKFRNEQRQDMKDIAQRMGPIAERVPLYRRMGMNINIMERVAREVHKTPDELIGSLATQTAPQTMNEMRQALAKFTPANKYEAQVKALDDAVADFRQMHAMSVNDYIHGKAGGAVSEGEQKRMDQVAATWHSWNGIKGFHKNVSSDIEAARNNAVKGVKHPLSATLWNLKIGSASPTLVFGGIDKEEMSSYDTSSPGNAGKRENSKNPFEKGSAQDPEVQRAAASKLFSPSQREKIKAGNK